MANKRNIFFDFDGTLTDPRHRLYQLFQELVPQSKLTFDEYWDIKRKRTDQNKLLTEWFNFSPEQITAFKKKWMAKVEEKSRLEQDIPFEGVGSFLENLSQNGYVLSLVTARQNPDLVAAQLKKFGWQKFFTHVLVTGQKDKKENLIKNSLPFNENDIFIGDTGEDIYVAKALGMKSIAVSSGFLSAEILKEYNPDYICESVLKIHETGLL